MRTIGQQMSAAILPLCTAFTGVAWAQPILFEDIELIDGRGSLWSTQRADR